MRKNLCKLFAVLILCLTLTVPACAHNRKQHDEELKRVLFGEHAVLTSDAQEKFDLLAGAAYLTIDQYNGNGEKELEALRKEILFFNPKGIEEFNFSAGSKHRQYTHRGWNFKYSDDKGNWDVRKKVLLGAVNHVMDFGLKSNRLTGYCDEVESFGALVYSVHMIGDHIEEKSYQDEGLLIGLGGRRDENSIIEELKKNCAVLFKDQKQSRTYSSLMSALDDVERHLSGIVLSKEGITPENFPDYHQCSEELLDVLVRYIPFLLSGESWFTHTFGR